MPEEPSPNDTAPYHSGDRHGLLALSIYLTLSLVFFGRPLIGHFRDTYIGTGPDPSIAMWSFVWWPYALVSIQRKRRATRDERYEKWAGEGEGVAAVAAMLRREQIKWGRL